VLAHTAAAWAVLAAGGDSVSVHHGTGGDLTVRPPRLEAAGLVVDGRLSEPAWAAAAVLASFTQLEPVEGAPASERTEVLVFFTPDAIHLGIRARAADPTAVRASFAERDRIGADDHVLILLDTYHDRQRAFAFAVNPRGVQQDGVFTENPGRRLGEQVDLAPDFHFDSAGRLTPEGYEVEIRIPFRSLKFPTSERQRWGLQVVRHVSSTGAWESWAPLSRNRAHTLAQSGTLEIHGITRGRHLEINPVATARREVGRGPALPGEGTVLTEGGLNLKVGLTSALTLDATVNPDFSQIEADAGQITANERFAIQYPEKRPFFLEGADLFATAEPLVHTRTIVSPHGGGKLTGTVAGTSIGVLGALDQAAAHEPAGPARVGIARLRRSLGTGASLGALVTERSDAQAYNRVGGLDGQAQFGGVYTLSGQVARSWSGDGDRERAASLARASLDRTGRHWGFLYTLRDVPADFEARTGHIRRRGVSDLLAVNRWTVYPAAGGVLESWTTRVSVNRLWEEGALRAGGAAIEGGAALRSTVALRGNQRATLGVGRRFFHLRPEAYAGYRVLRGDGSSIPAGLLVDPSLEGLPSVFVEASSSALRTLTASAEVRREETPIFAEGSRGLEWSGAASVRVQPIPPVRLEGSVRAATIDRVDDRSRYSTSLLPRLRLEVQLTRAAFVRAVGQYAYEEVDLLRAPDGTPFRLEDGAALRMRRGERIREGEPLPQPVRADLLFGLQPSPGTVLFLGYGREADEGEARRDGQPERAWRGAFLKVSYLFRP
jgi:hypothetical protein